LKIDANFAKQSQSKQLTCASINGCRKVLCVIAAIKKNSVQDQDVRRQIFSNQF